MTTTAEQFDTDNYVFVPQMIDGPLLDVVYSYASMRARNNDMQDGDVQVANTPISLGDRLMETLLDYLRPKMEAATGLELYPTYSCFRVYKNGDSLARHTDRRSCEISVTLTLGFEADDPWPIYVGDADAPKAIDMQPGDAVVYKGCVLEHWREQFTGKQHAQVFLHYVDANGPNADCKYDGRPGGLGTFTFADGTTVQPT